jgi:hypothetical protein
MVGPQNIPHWLANHCPAKDNGWIKSDSFFTDCLICGIIACPIQQFVSCFYVIPERYGYFEVKRINKAMRKNIVDLFAK